MHAELLKLLRCPVTRTSLRMEVISTSTKLFNGIEEEIIQEGLLFAEEDWFYPIINGIPRLIVEAFLDYDNFLSKYLQDYSVRKIQLEKKYGGLIKYVIKKNNRTKKVFPRNGIFSIFKPIKPGAWTPMECFPVF